jgi:formylglycine-generating enzyme required for sulfatase activity
MEYLESCTERLQVINNVPTRTRLGEKITPVHTFLTHGFWLGRFEVTQAEWKQLVATEPWKGKAHTKEGDDFPATVVSWNEAIGFCRKFTEQEQKADRLPDGWQYTLPTEAQWERACRAGTNSKFNFGDDEAQLDEFAWYNANTLGGGEQFAHRCGQKKANPWGLHDMHGNVWEWCRDSYVDRVPGGRNPEVAFPRGTHVIRGGGGNECAVACRSAFRFSLSVEQHDPAYVGFRVALTPVERAK